MIVDWIAAKLPWWDLNAVVLSQSDALFALPVAECLSFPAWGLSCGGSPNHLAVSMRHPGSSSRSGGAIP